MQTQKTLTALAKSFSYTKSTCIIFISSCSGTWGGSEELWSATAKYLQQQGHEVHAFKDNVVNSHHRIAELQQAGIPVIDTNISEPEFTRIIHWILRHLGHEHILNRVLRRLGRLHHRLSPYLPPQWRANPPQPPLTRLLGELQPNLVVIS